MTKSQEGLKSTRLYFLNIGQVIKVIQVQNIMNMSIIGYTILRTKLGQTRFTGCCCWIIIGVHYT